MYRRVSQAEKMDLLSNHVLARYMHDRVDEQSLFLSVYRRWLMGHSKLVGSVETVVLLLVFRVRGCLIFSGTPGSDFGFRFPAVSIENQETRYW